LRIGIKTGFLVIFVNFDSFWVKNNKKGLLRIATTKKPLTLAGQKFSFIAHRQRF
jgi:hypothetical protein